MTFEINKMVRQGVQNRGSDVDWNFTRNPGLIELQFGEMQEDIPETVLAAIAQASHDSHIYSGLLEELVETIFQVKKIPKENLVIVNATDKAFRLLSETFINPGDDCLLFPPTYPSIIPGVKILQGNIVELEMQSDFQLPATQIIRNHISSKTKFIYIANPNTPTGNLVVTREQIIELLALGPIVIVDECYYELSNVTMSDLVFEFPNLVITRTLSKTYGLAGLRIGYMIAHQEVASVLRYVEYSLEPVPPVTSLAGAVAAIKNEKSIQENLHKLVQSRTMLAEGLRKLGLIVYDSLTTSLLVDTQNINISAGDFVKRMRDFGVIVKTCVVYGSAKPSWVYFGTPSLKQTPIVLERVKQLIRTINEEAD